MSLYFLDFFHSLFFYCNSFGIYQDNICIGVYKWIQLEHIQSEKIKCNLPIPMQNKITIQLYMKVKIRLDDYIITDLKPASSDISLKYSERFS